MRLLGFITVFRNDRNRHEIWQQSSPLLVQANDQRVRVGRLDALYIRALAGARAFKEARRLCKRRRQHRI